MVLAGIAGLVARANAESGYIDLTKIKTQINSDLFKIETIENEQVLIVVGNRYNEEIDDFTGRRTDDVRGKVILFGEPLRDYSMTVDMKFIGFNLDYPPGGGWFGFALRAQDLENYEIIWFMPGGAEPTNTIAYVPVAHGVVPWWAEAYEKQEKGDYELPVNEWFTTRVDVMGDECSLFVNDQFIFKKKLTYYLTSGTPGLYVGTATDVAFRRIEIEDID